MIFHQRGSVLLLTLFFIGLLSFLILELLQHHYMEQLLVRNKINYLIAFQAAEEGLYLAHQKLPQLGVGYRQDQVLINYETILQSEDACKNKIFKLYSTAKSEKIRVRLSATVVRLGVDIHHECQKPSYNWRWQQYH